MIRLLMGITVPDTGGSQKVVFHLLSGLPQDQYQVTLLTSPGGGLLDWVQELNKNRTNKITVVTCAHIRREVSPLEDVRAYVFLLRLLSRNRYDVAHFHNSKLGLLGRLAARMTGVPTVLYTVHGWGLNPETTGRLYGILNVVERMMARLTDAIIFVSESDRRVGIAHHWARESNSLVIHNGVPSATASSPLRATLGIPQEVPVILFVARLTDPKEPAFCIRVCARLATQGIDHRLAIVGDGPKKTECQHIIEELHMESQVCLLGHREDARAMLSDADIFCLFSRWEGLPVSILEAMAAGLPVVANAVGGIPELIEEGRTGFLIEGFDLNAAAGALAALARDKALRQAMGAAARQVIVEKFTVNSMVCEYRRIYERRPAGEPLRGGYDVGWN